MSNQLEQVISNFGPDEVNEKLLERRNLISKIAIKPPFHGLFNKAHTHKNFVSNDFCQWIIKKSEEYSKLHGGWTKERHKNYPTTDLPVRSIPTLNVPLFNFTTLNILPLIAEHYKLNLYFLSIVDLFIVKYEAEGQDHLGKHRDGSIISFNILLNDDFEGGGTSIEHTCKPGSNELSEFNEVLYQGEKTDLLIHPGKLKHGGNHITNGVRYILVGFIEFCSSGRGREYDQIEKPEQREKITTINESKIRVEKLKIVRSAKREN